MHDGLFRPAGGCIRVRTRVPGDKSISHRAVLLGSVATGATRISGFLAARDTLCTIGAMQALGVELEYDAGLSNLVVHGGGWEGLREPEDVIGVGNAGTLIRLLPGLLAGSPFLSVLTGDASIRSRPMDRILQPLSAMGASVYGRSHGRRAPIVIRGGPLRGIHHTLSAASAQVKSCLLLAGLRAEGTTVIDEPAPTRDHTERLLRHMGVAVHRAGSTQETGSVWIEAAGDLRARDIEIPGDFSSAAFLLVAALLHPDAELTIDGLGLNPTRTGLLAVLSRMGADIEAHGIPGDTTDWAEPAGSITVRSSRLEATSIESEEVPLLVDELPVWALAAARADGTSRLRGAGELRLKESDRLAGVTSILRDLGVRAEEHPDGLDITGRPSPWQEAAIEARGDHRLAMMGAIAGLLSTKGVSVDDTACIDVSFPGFIDSIRSMSGQNG